MTSSRIGAMVLRWVEDRPRGRPELGADTESEEDDRSQDPPPVPTGKHLRVSEVAVVALGHRHLHHAPAATDRPEEEVWLELVRVEPGLMKLDPRIARDCGRERAEAVRRVGGVEPGRH